MPKTSMIDTVVPAFAPVENIPLTLRGGRIRELDGLRGIAALIVFLWHCLDVF